MSDRRKKKRVKAIPKEVLLERQYRLKKKLLREIRTLFRKLSKASELTQKEIAERADMDPSEVSRLINGQTNMTLATLSDLLEGMQAELQVRAIPFSELAASDAELTVGRGGVWSGSVAIDTCLRPIHESDQILTPHWDRDPEKTSPNTWRIEGVGIAKAQSFGFHQLFGDHQRSEHIGSLADEDASSHKLEDLHS